VRSSAASCATTSSSARAASARSSSSCRRSSSSAAAASRRCRRAACSEALPLLAGQKLLTPAAVEGARRFVPVPPAGREPPAGTQRRADPRPAAGRDGAGAPGARHGTLRTGRRWPRRSSGTGARERPLPGAHLRADGARVPRAATDRTLAAPARARAGGQRGATNCCAGIGIQEGTRSSRESRRCARAPTAAARRDRPAAAARPCCPSCWRPSRAARTRRWRSAASCTSSSASAGAPCTSRC